MNFLERELQSLETSDFPAAARDALVEAARREILGIRHGDLPIWQQALDTLPGIIPSDVSLNCAAPSIGRAEDLEPGQREALITALQRLHPWRKGPFSLFGVTLDTEWRSDLKWDRLSSEISALQGRRVLDVGCGNGYYALRMAGCGAAAVIGIDPTLRFIAQFGVLRRYIPGLPMALLPLRCEDLPETLGCFDTAFSMGVIYHRRSPFDHLAELFGALRPGGELILETLVVPETFGDVLVPQDRYAKMRNVWFLPSPAFLRRWLERAGFTDVRIADVSPTTPAEQRRTAWMQFESLTDFLDSEDNNKTVEGYPAPMRAVAIARRP